jgi:hypothetical protein
MLSARRSEMRSQSYKLNVTKLKPSICNCSWLDQLIQFSPLKYFLPCVRTVLSQHCMRLRIFVFCACALPHAFHTLVKYLTPNFEELNSLSFRCVLITTCAPKYHWQLRGFLSAYRFARLSLSVVTLNYAERGMR